MLRINRTFFYNSALFFHERKEFLAHSDVITLHRANFFNRKKQLKNETFIDEYTVVNFFHARVKIEEPV